MPNECRRITIPTPKSAIRTTIEKINLDFNGCVYSVKEILDLL